jgi:ACS family hexuronate transporter-like MFS transporter
MTSSRLRWLAIVVFLLSSTLNYLDRGLLNALAPTVMSEFHLDNYQYGLVLSVFSIVYAFTAPLAGIFIDRVGLNIGSSLAVSIWSLAGVATGFSGSYAALMGWRTLLGIAEAAGVPGFGKANAIYLEPRELAFGTSLNQVGISMGSIAAPLVVAAMAPHYGWRSPFVVCGILGFVWVPLWLWTSAKIPARPLPPSQKIEGFSEMLRDRRFWGLVVATVFIMSVYTLWTNWTTIYFVREWKLSQQAANVKFAWIPHIFGALGGFFGGWIVFRSMRRGATARDARIRVSWFSAALLLAMTAAIPYLPNQAMAAGAISMSFFFCVAVSANLYAMPIDLFGPARAAFGVAALTGSYGLMQAFLSPAIGSMVDHFGFRAVCLAMASLPLIGVGVLQLSTR